jgi:succinate-acetate transporter protein
LQLHWVPAAQPHELAIGVLALTLPLQLIACIYGFLCRDVVAATGVGVLGGTWAAVGVIWLTSPPNTTSPGLGMILAVAAGALPVPTIAALTSKVVASLVLFLAAARFAITGAYELSSAQIWQYASGICGIVVAVLALYTALAAEMDSATRRSLLPLLRRAHGHRAISGRLGDQIATLAREAGVRQQL